MDVQTVVAALLGAGGATTITATIRGFTAIRSGANARAREAIDDLGRWRDELDRRARVAERDRDYWRGVCAAYGWQLRAAGRVPDPEFPIPPSERT